MRRQRQILTAALVRDGQVRFAREAVVRLDRVDAFLLQQIDRRTRFLGSGNHDRGQLAQLLRVFRPVLSRTIDVRSGAKDARTDPRAAVDLRAPAIQLFE